LCCLGQLRQIFVSAFVASAQQSQEVLASDVRADPWGRLGLLPLRPQLSDVKIGRVVIIAQVVGFQLPGPRPLCSSCPPSGERSGA
jgi:hypothetical protein